jgi:hypothetical protein
MRPTAAVRSADPPPRSRAGVGHVAEVGLDEGMAPAAERHHAERRRVPRQVEDKVVRLGQRGGVDLADRDADRGRIAADQRQLRVVLGTALDVAARSRILKAGEERVAPLASSGWGCCWASATVPDSAAASIRGASGAPTT